MYGMQCKRYSAREELQMQCVRRICQSVGVMLDTLFPVNN